MMHDEDVDDDLTSEAPEIDVAGRKARAGSGRRAARSVQRARKLYEGSDWQPSTEAEFRLQEAMILALLDLTDAIREQTVSAPR